MVMSCPNYTPFTVNKGQKSACFRNLNSFNQKNLNESLRRENQLCSHYLGKTIIFPVACSMDIEENTKCFPPYFAMLPVEVISGKMPISFNFTADLRCLVSPTQIKRLPAFFSICWLNYGQEGISIFVILKSRRNAFRMQTRGILVPFQCSKWSYNTADTFCILIFFTELPQFTLKC